MTMPVIRRRTTVYVAAILSAALVGCSGSDTPNADGETTAATANSDAFPVTVESDFGDVTIEKQPERVVLVHPWYLDATLALGVQPVAIFYSDEESLLADEPWVEGRYTGTVDPSLTSGGEAMPEAIAAWEPDLIIVADYQVDEQIYEQLSEVAPTWAVPRPLGASGTWTAIGELTGHAEQAKTANQEVEDAYAAAAEKLSGLAGKTYISVSAEETEINVTSFGPWRELGLVPADNAALDSSGFYTISKENMDELDADLVAVGTYASENVEEALEADPRFRELPAYKNDAVFFYDTAMATAQLGPTSAIWLVDKIVAQFEDSPLNTKGQ
ncbi:ABC transporter substrate-binding protein [Brevibacterium aurantiacum]|uniref:ABC transporter substrate-binding protein n=1 Tax=Brevibacterium aurantiacum TaxID=273384 RepID=UPI001868D6B5|nr:ABC transporter substrate-binding protein [Brevibacterium aurantiacum]